MRGVEPGDLIRWREQVWLVRKVDSALSAAVVEAADRSTEILSSEAVHSESAAVWCRPAQEWPAVGLPFRPGVSRLMELQSCASGSLLVRLRDWVKLDDFQLGGALYLNPELNLGFGDRLAGMFVDPMGRRVVLPINIPKNFQVFVNKVPVSVEPTVQEPVVPALFARLKGER